MMLEFTICFATGLIIGFFTGYYFGRYRRDANDN